MTHYSRPSHSISLLRVEELTQRQIISLAYCVLSFTDIITTYFGIKYYGLKENAFITDFILNHYGWMGVIIRQTVISILFIYIFRYMPNITFKYFKYPAWILILVYAFFTTVNNCYLMVVN